MNDVFVIERYFLFTVFVRPNYIEGLLQMNSRRPARISANTFSRRSKKKFMAAPIKGCCSSEQLFSSQRLLKISSSQSAMDRISIDCLFKLETVSRLNCMFVSGNKSFLLESGKEALEAAFYFTGSIGVTQLSGDIFASQSKSIRICRVGFELFFIIGQLSQLMKIFNNGMLRQFDKYMEKATGKTRSDPQDWKFQFSTRHAFYASLGLMGLYHLYKEYEYRSHKNSVQIDLIARKDAFASCTLRSDIMNKIMHFADRGSLENLNFANKLYFSHLRSALSESDEVLGKKEIVLFRTESQKYDIKLFKLHCFDLEFLLTPNGSIIKRTRKYQLKVGNVGYFGKKSEFNDKKPDSKKQKKKHGKGHQQSTQINMKELYKKTNFKFQSNCRKINQLNDWIIALNKMPPPAPNDTPEKEKKIEMYDDAKPKEQNQHSPLDRSKSKDWDEDKPKDSFLVKQCRKQAKLIEREVVSKLKTAHKKENNHNYTTL